MPAALTVIWEIKQLEIGDWRLEIHESPISNLTNLPHFTPCSQLNQTEGFLISISHICRTFVILLKLG